ncbi:hypothetical protein GW17_00061181 [Ensete ventricosum]|nr:hypothetical protein GW17_00061181 [Ensete ventricosum]
MNTRRKSGVPSNSLIFIILHGIKAIALEQSFSSSAATDSCRPPLLSPSVSVVEGSTIASPLLIRCLRRCNHQFPTAAVALLPQPPLLIAPASSPALGLPVFPLPPSASSFVTASLSLLVDTAVASAVTQRS